MNLAPADLPKEGGRFDLPIALGILAASEQIPQSSLNKFEFIGELALTGELRKIDGVIPAAISATQDRRALVVSHANEQEAALCRGSTCYRAEHLLNVCRYLFELDQATDSAIQESVGSSTLPIIESIEEKAEPFFGPDLAQVKGQPHAKRALEIAAAGSHNLLMSGPPGTGKSMLAQCLPGILPPLTETEALEVASLYSVSTQPQRGYFYQRPFRQPHHTSSGVALVGGGTRPK